MLSGKWLAIEAHSQSQLQTHSLRNTFCDNGNALDLGVLHQFHGGAVDGSRRRKVHDGVNVGVLGHGLSNVLIDGQEGLAGTPVPVDCISCCIIVYQLNWLLLHLADELTTKGVDDTRYRWGATLADEVKVEHALHGSGLHATGSGQSCAIECAQRLSEVQRTRQSIVSYCGKECVREGTAHDWEGRNDGCCRWRIASHWQCWPKEQQTAWRWQSLWRIGLLAIVGSTLQLEEGFVRVISPIRKFRLFKDARELGSKQQQRAPRKEMGRAIQR